MLRRAGFAGAIALAAISAAPALAADWTGFYAGIYAGVSARNDSDIHGAIVIADLDEDGGIEYPAHVINDGGIDPLAFKLLKQGIEMFSYIPSGRAVAAIGDATLTYAPAVTAGFLAGYSFGNGFRLENDWSVSAFRATSITFTDSKSQNIDGGYSGPDWVWSLVGQHQGGGAPPIELTSQFNISTAQFILADLWYDLDNDSAFTPYLGGGVGIAHLSAQYSPTMVGRSLTAAAQLGAGLRVDLKDTSFLDLGYRLKVAGGTGLTTTSIEDFGSGFIGLGVTENNIVTVQTLQAGLMMRLK